MSEIMLSKEQLEKLVGNVMRGATVAQATGVSPAALEGLYALGHDLYNSGNFKDAQVVFQALSIYNSHDSRFWMGLAGCRQALEQYEAAIDAYQLAAVADQLKNPEPILYAVKCLLKLSRKADAIAGLEAVLKLGDADDPRYLSVPSQAQALLDLLKGDKA